MTLNVEPKFQVVADNCHCGVSDSKGACDGRLCIYAYLEVSGETEALVVPAQGGPPVKRKQTWSDSILPQRVCGNFEVDYGKLVRPCGNRPLPETVGPGSVEYRDGPGLPTKFQNNGAPTVEKYEEKEPCLRAEISFDWISGKVIAAAAGKASATLTPPGVTGTAGGAGAVALADAVPYQLKVGVTLCCRSGAKSVALDTDVHNTSDALIVFDRAK